MYKMYIGIDEGEEGFILPVLPEKIEITEKGDNKTYNVINLGEVNNINLPLPTDISFESHFPLQKNSFISVEEKRLMDPYYYVKKINGWRNNLKKIRFIFTGGPLEINDLFSIENFKYEEHGGEVGDIYYSLDLKRYKEYSVRKVTQKANSNGGFVFIPAKEETPPTNPANTTYTVVKGDTLWHIAKRFLCDGTRYPEIAKLNNIDNEDLIYPGQVFKIPTS